MNERGRHTDALQESFDRRAVGTSFQKQPHLSGQCCIGFALRFVVHVEHVVDDDSIDLLRQSGRRLQREYRTGRMSVDVSPATRGVDDRIEIIDLPRHAVGECVCAVTAPAAIVGAHSGFGGERSRVGHHGTEPAVVEPAFRPDTPDRW